MSAGLLYIEASAQPSVLPCPDHRRTTKSVRRSIPANSTSRSLCKSRATIKNTTLLPNGLEVAYVSLPEVAFLYREIFEEQSYLQHGICLKPGDTVIDVGANLGLFSLFAAEAVGSQGRVVAAEPIPGTYAALQFNLASFLQRCKDQSVNAASMKALNVGVGSSNGLATFISYQNAAGWSTMCPNEAEVEAAMGVFLGNALSTGHGIPATRLARLGGFLQQHLPKPFFDAIWKWYVGRMLSSTERIPCKMQTISDIIDTEGLDTVDLLKVDVERAELQVLLGVEKRHWAGIRQVVLECHDFADNLAAIDAVIERAGFDEVYRVQDKALQGSTLHNMYCRRTR